MSGLTRKPLLALGALSPVTITIAPAGPGSTLHYAEGAAKWTMATFDVEARLRFLGADGAWYDAWPPAANPDPSPFGDAVYFDTPQLPQAVRLDAGDRVVIAPVGRTTGLPANERDLAPEIDG
jgi:hypothetical protein